MDGDKKFDYRFSRRKLDGVIFDYLRKQGFHDAADTMKNESKVSFLSKKKLNFSKISFF